MPQTPHSFTHRLCHTNQVSPSPSHASAHLSLTLFSHSVITLLPSPITHPLRRSSSLTHPFLLLRQTFTTSLIILFTNHPLSLTLFSHSVKHSSLRRSPSSLTQSIWHSSPSTKDLIKHSEVYRGLIITLWFQVVFFYFGFCFEFLIELLKKIEALLFFEIWFCLWVCLYLLWNRIMFLGLFIFAEDLICYIGFSWVWGVMFRVKGRNLKFYVSVYLKISETHYL